MALVSVIRDLHRRKARERRNLALAEGVRLVEEMVVTGARCKGAVVAPALAATPRGAALRSALVAAGVPLVEVDDDELAGLAATEQPQGVVAVYEPRRWTMAEMTTAARHPLLILDGVQDPGNVGTMARTAMAFGASGLVALSGTADLTNPKSIRSAMGALFRLPHMHASDDTTFEALAGSGTAVWIADTDGDPIEAIDAADPVAIVLGNEGAGVRPEVAARGSRRVRITMHPAAESLNVAVAAGILLHHLTARWHGRMDRTDA